jgi:hypothetical protein
VQSAVQVSQGDEPHFAVIASRINGHDCGVEIELDRALERQPAFAYISFVLSGIKGDF